MGIRKRGDRWFVDVSVKGIRRTATAATEEEAKSAQEELRHELEMGKDSARARSNARPWTLQETLDKTLSLAAPEGWKGTSYAKQSKINGDDAVRFFGPNKRLADLTREDIDEWLADCESRGNSDSTLNRKLSALSKMSKVAISYGGLSGPLSLPRMRKEPVGRIRQISDEEERQLLAYFALAGRSTMYDAVAVLIDTGVRCGELLNIRPSDVDMNNGVLMVYGTEGKGTKNGKIRSVPMTKRVREIMGARLSGVTCFKIDKSELRHSWDRARAHMGLTEDKQFTPHVCRHTCASRLVQKGVTLPVVKEWLGHSNIQTTMRYAHLYPKDLMNALKALEGDR